MGYVGSENIIGYPCTGGYNVYTERGGGDIIWGIHGEYPYADGNYDFR